MMKKEYLREVHWDEISLNINYHLILINPIGDNHKPIGNNKESYTVFTTRPLEDNEPLYKDRLVLLHIATKSLVRALKKAEEKINQTIKENDDIEIIISRTEQTINIKELIIHKQGYKEVEQEHIY